MWIELESVAPLIPYYMLHVIIVNRFYNIEFNPLWIIYVLFIYKRIDVICSCIFSKGNLSHKHEIVKVTNPPQNTSYCAFKITTIYYLCKNVLRILENGKVPLQNKLLEKKPKYINTCTFKFVYICNYRVYVRARFVWKCDNFNCYKCGIIFIFANQ